MFRFPLVSLFSVLCFLILASVPAYAQEALEAQESQEAGDLEPVAETTETAAAPAKTSCPSCTVCGEAEKGTAGDTEGGYCDIYARQLEYRKNSKEFRDSIEKRRAAFEAPRIQALEAFRRNREELYKQESKEYQLELAREAEEAEKALAAKNSAEAPDSAEVAEDKAEVTETASVSGEEATDAAPAGETEDAAPAEGVKEKVVEESDSEAKPRKKIIMPEDAPDF